MKLKSDLGAFMPSSREMVPTARTELTFITMHRFDLRVVGCSVLFYMHQVHFTLTYGLVL